MNTSPPECSRRQPARVRLRAALLCLALCLPALLPEPAGATTDDAGVVIAAKQEARALRRLSEEVLKSKSPVYTGDVVNTNPVGRLQILFRDNSALTMAPDTQVTINEYVYAAESRRDEPGMKIAVARGLTRFMSGDIVRVRPGAMRVETPRAVLGIQGTVVVVDVDPNAPFGNPAERYALIETTSSKGLLIRITGTGKTLLLEMPGTEVVIFADGTVLKRPLSAAALETWRALLALGTGGKKKGTSGGPEFLNLMAATQDNAQGFLPRTPDGVIRVSQVNPVSPLSPVIPVAPTLSGTYSGLLSGTWLAGSTPVSWNGAFTIGIGDLGGAFAVNSVNVSGGNPNPSSLFNFSLQGAGPNLANVGAGGAFAFTANHQPPWTITSSNPRLSSINGKGQVAGPSMNLDVEGFDGGPPPSSIFSGSGTGTKQ